MQRLQAVQNTAARLITGARRRDHISPAIRQLHWLPVRQRVQFKLAVLVFKALHGLVPQCLTDDCQLVSAAGKGAGSYLAGMAVAIPILNVDGRRHTNNFSKNI